MLFTVVKTGVFTWAYAVFASVPELSHGYTLELYSDLLLGAGFWDFLVLGLGALGFAGLEVRRLRDKG